MEWIFVASGAFFALIGICIFDSGIRDLIRAKASVDWPTSPGKVLSSSVEQHHWDDGDTYYHAEVVYEFNVNNTLTVASELHMETVVPATLHMPKKL
jgi:hypothetical protein